MKSLLLFAISFLCFSPLCLAQTVWPGDVNNNGIVNEIDFLYLGYAFGQVGPARSIESSEWKEQDIANLWEGTFPEGLNFAYADCDGNGVVDELDADVIEEYIGRTYIDGAFDEILEANSELVPKFFLSRTEDFAVAPGETIELDISLDNVDGERIEESILGFAFTLNVDASFFEMEQTQYKEDLSTWIYIQGPTTNRTFLNEQEGKFTVAYTKTNGIGVNGSGFFGKTSFVIEDDIIDFLKPTDTVRISIDSITLVTDDLERIVIGGTSIDLDILGRPTSTYNLRAGRLP